MLAMDHSAATLQDHEPTFQEPSTDIQYGFTPVRQKSCPENDHQKMMFSAANTAKKKTHQTRDSAHKHCQRTDKQLSAREKHTDVSQM